MWMVFFMILTGSIIFMASFIAYIRLEMLKSTVQNKTFLFTLLSCGRIKDK